MRLSGVDGGARGGWLRRSADLTLIRAERSYLCGSTVGGRGRRPSVRAANCLGRFRPVKELVTPPPQSEGQGLPSEAAPADGCGCGVLSSETLSPWSCS